MIIKAPAKINLGLKVLYKREDGYHELESLMQQIALADFLAVSDSYSVEIICRGADIPLKDNLVYKTVCEMQRFLTVSRGVNLVLYKNIPLGAGLAGGSADAAATIKGLNSLWQLNLSMTEMLFIGEKIGADVPFCLLGGTVLARGKGEKLLPLPGIPFFPLVLAIPPLLSVSTAEIFALFEANKLQKDFFYNDVISIIEKRDKNAFINWLEETKDINMLEDTVIKKYPEVKRLKNCFKEIGLFPVMSGSGPAVFALTTNMKKAGEAAFWLSQKGYLSWTSWTI